MSYPPWPNGPLPVGTKRWAVARALKRQYIEGKSISDLVEETDYSEAKVRKLLSQAHTLLREEDRKAPRAPMGGR